ncbi:hypothetical protein HDU92_007425 [Lobulomyces angularis]|nr:hypothetical protein HDU92_007425 [Lobulomyces angularis]
MNENVSESNFTEKDQNNYGLLKRANVIKKWKKLTNDDDDFKKPTEEATDYLIPNKNLKDENTILQTPNDYSNDKPNIENFLVPKINVTNTESKILRRSTERGRSRNNDFLEIKIKKKSRSRSKSNHRHHDISHNNGPPGYCLIKKKTELKSNLLKNDEPLVSALVELLKNDDMDSFNYKNILNLSEVQNIKKHDTLKRTKTLTKQKTTTLRQQDADESDKEYFNQNSISLEKQFTLKKQISVKHNRTLKKISTQRDLINPFQESSEDDDSEFFDARENLNNFTLKKKTTVKKNFRKQTRFLKDMDEKGCSLNSHLSNANIDAKLNIPTGQMKKSSDFDFSRRVTTIKKKTTPLVIRKNNTIYRSKNDMVALEVTPELAKKINERMEISKRENLEILSSDEDNFFDAQDWNYFDHNDENSITADSTKKIVMVPRTFFNLIASRAGEGTALFGNALKVVAGPATFIAGPAVSGLLSTAGSGLAASGSAIVDKFGRKQTKKRNLQNRKALLKYSSSELLSTEVSILAMGDRLGKTTSGKVLSQGFGAVLESGIIAGGISVLASSIAVSASNLNPELQQKLLENMYIKGSLEYAEHIGNLKTYLPSSLQALAEAAGTIATVSGGLDAVEMEISEDDGDEDWDDF